MVIDIIDFFSAWSYQSLVEDSQSQPMNGGICTPMKSSCKKYYSMCYKFCLHQENEQGLHLRSGIVRVVWVSIVLGGIWKVVVTGAQINTILKYYVFCKYRKMRMQFQTCFGSCASENGASLVLVIFDRYCKCSSGIRHDTSCLCL